MGALTSSIVRLSTSATDSPVASVEGWLRHKKRYLTKVRPGTQFIAKAFHALGFYPLCYLLPLPSA